MSTHHPGKIFSLLAMTALSLLCTSTQAMAQGRAKIQIEPGVRLGLGDWADISGPGFGGTLGFHYAVTPELTLLARGGYFFGLPKTTEENFFFFNFVTHSKTNELPLLLGARYHLPSNGAPGPFWAGLEVGMTQLHYQVWVEDGNGDRDYLGDEDGERELEPTLVIGAGYSLDQIDPHIALHWIPVENNDDFVAIVLTIGIDLASF